VNERANEPQLFEADTETIPEVHIGPKLIVAEVVVEVVV